MKKMDILLTNDDGIHAVGLRCLYRSLTQAGHNVCVVAPLTEQSAVGHSVTIFSPVRVKEIKEDGFRGLGLSGTPVDCVKWAVSHYLSSRPDLIISGINNGANVGVDVIYSGTVSAATEGALVGLSALAVSIDNFSPQDLTDQAEWVSRFVAKFSWSSLPERCVLNLNFPAIDLDECAGLKVCPQTDVAYKDFYDHRQDPRGRSYFWLGGEIPMHKVQENTDRYLLSKGYITLTPLRFDLTNWELLKELEKWSINEG
jgi:5'-nucleotidase